MKAKDLAKQLGVSPATISLVLNNKPGISNALRHSLLEKIRELGCGGMLENAYAAPSGEEDADIQTVCRPRPAIAYLIYTDCDEKSERFAFYPAVLEGAEMEARESCFNFVVLHMSREGNSNLRSLLDYSGEVAGLIIQAKKITDTILSDLKPLGLPYVFIDAYRPDIGVSSVSVNNEQGIFSAVRYLKEMGHRKIGYVSTGTEGDSHVERRRCFHQALWEYSLEDNRDYYYTFQDSNSLSCNELCAVWRDKTILPTALMAENDHVAWRLLKLLECCGLRVPEDISLVGFDDRSICTMMEPNLTTVKNSRHLMGRECVLLLKNMIRLQKLGVPNITLKLELPTELIIRDSVKKLDVEPLST